MVLRLKLIPVSSILPLAFALPGWATPIVPEASSATQVTQTGNEYTITGGALSADGQNLFHSFEAFGLSQAQIANFLTAPNVQAVLGRINGGNASYIDGILQVTGSSADLYLINPSGILFGPHATLNLAGSFTAATANGIQLGNGSFDAVGTPDYAQLVGTPTGFTFTAATPAAVVNAGDLAVSPGESLMLIGGQVISTGTLSAPGGDIVIAAVPGENQVRISQDGMALNLVLDTLPGGAVAHANTLNPLSLPALLTGGGTVSNATGIQVLPDGSVALVGSDLTLPDEPGVAVVSGTVDVSASAIGGSVTVVGDRVALTAATIDASGANGGGTVHVGGAYQGDPRLPASQVTYVDAETTITASALDGSAGSGDGGEVILWADGITGFYGQILAEGGSNGGDGGFVEVSGLQNLAFRGTVSTSAPQGQGGTLLLDPTDIVILDGEPPDPDPGDFSPVLADLDSDANRVLFQTADYDSPAADQSTSYLYESQLESLPSDQSLVIQATGNITIQDLSPDDDPSAPNYDPDDLGLVFLNDGDFEFSFYRRNATTSITFDAGGSFETLDTRNSIIASTRNIYIEADGDIYIGDIIAQSGDVNISGNTVTAGEIDVAVDYGGGGSIRIESVGSMNIGSVIASDSSNDK